MADSNLRTIIDNLSVETLRDYLEQSLQQNPQQREHFISTFREQSERDALLAALNPEKRKMLTENRLLTTC